MQPPKHPGTAAVLSLLIPGVGQFYNGDFWRGVFWLIITPGFWIGSGGLLGWVCHVAAAITAYRRAESKNIARAEATGMLVLLMLLPLAAMAQSAAGLRWTAPDGWAAEGPRPMRAATYTITPVAGDQGVAECVVNFFGAGQGGAVDANVERWKGQVLGADGQPAPAKVERRTIGGIPVTIVDSSGTYTGMGGPMMGGSKPVANYRLIGAIAEGPGGNVFFKLTGPAKTIAANQKSFDQMIASLRREK